MMKSICKNTVKSLLLLFAAVCAFTSCDDNTDTFGSIVMPGSDVTTVTQAVFDTGTRSVKIDSLVAKSSDCYLGRVTDPETGSTTTCSFLAQFYSLEDYSLPKLDAMHKENGQPVADSVELRLYVKSYYGDSLNSLKIGVYELDADKILDEETTYYTNIDAQQYVSRKPDAVKKEMSFAVADLSLPDSIRYSSDYSKNILIKLPVAFGTKILRKYYENPDNFKNSYNFIRNVLPGFYFKTISGNGTLVDIDIATLSVYFRYNDGDTTYVGVQRVAATQEVIQSNRIENENIDKLIAQTDYTYLKTPAAIFTEVSLPIDNIYENHETDSVNSAKIIFRRYNSNIVTQYKLSTPSSVLMVPKGELNDFFDNNRVPDNYKTFLASYDNVYNSYSFSNIANLISYLKRQRDTKAGVTENDSPQARKAKLDAWMAANPDWNKVMLVPVTAETSTMGSVLSVSNDFSLSGARLKGGSANPVKMSVVYSRFNQ